MDPGLAEICLPDVMKRCAAAEPRMRVVVEERAWLDPQRQQRPVDVAVGYDYPGLAEPSDAHHRTMELAEDELVLLSPPEWVVESFASCDPYPWVMATPDCQARLWTEREVRSAGLVPRIQYQVDAPSTQVSLVVAGLALAIVPAMFVQTAAVHVARLQGEPRVTVRASMPRSRTRSGMAEIVCQQMRQYLKERVAAPS